MISIINRQRHEKIDSRSVKQIALQTLDAVGYATLDVNLVFVGDRTIHRLNLEYRNIDKPTDVLSFPYLELPSPYFDTPATVKNFAAEADALLGEVVISTQTARRYGQELGLTFPVEIKTLVIHGILHVCGYDHETDHGEMARLERRLRKRFLGASVDW
ncbi:MAG: rRNA maturation RNase YbeY [Blastocatellia bacterium]|nr:rRNA maturation RNase YbeY [Blastocatellia bacterium]